MNTLFLLLLLASFIALIVLLPIVIVKAIQKKKSKTSFRNMGITIVVAFVSIIGFTVTLDNEELENDSTAVETSAPTTTEDVTNETEEKPVVEAKPIELSPREKMISKVTALFDQNLAFDTGSYIVGEIPKGEYAFIRFDGSGQYYSEEDQNGEIVDNENFDSFGYVYVHQVGNISNDGLLVNVDALSGLGVSGAKELFEVINEKTEYKDAGWYKVGIDLSAGQYVAESYGDGYVAVLTGPVGNNDIVDNEIFNGKYSFKASNGQFVQISGAVIAQ